MAKEKTRILNDLKNRMKNSDSGLALMEYYNRYVRAKKKKK